MLPACRDAASQSWTAARMRPRSTGGSPGRWCPVTSRTTRSPRAIACSRHRSIAAQAPSRFMPWRSRTRSSSTSPLLRRLSQLPSSVFCVIGTGLAGAAAADRGTYFAVLGFPTASCCFSVGCGVSFSRDRGRIVAATCAHSWASSGLRERTSGHALGDEDQRLSGRRHAACDRDGRRPRAPERVEPIGALDRAARVLRDP